MAQYDTRNTYTGRAGTDVAVDEGLRSHMLGVYNYMAAGVAFTGIVAYFTSQLARSSPEVATLLFASPLKWVVMFAPLAMVLFLSVRAYKMSVGATQIAFWVFAGVMGVSLASIFLVFSGESIARVFFVTAAAFAGLSIYGYTTKKDLSGWGTFLIMGVIGLIIASVVNIFVGSSAMQFAISVIGVLVFAGLTAYDTQRIKDEFLYFRNDAEMVAKGAIMGALNLYLDFINMFISMLNLFGSSSE